MTKLEELYKGLLARKVTTLEEITRIAKKIVSPNATSEYVRKKYIEKLLAQKKVVRVRKGLYAVLDPNQKPKTFSPDHFLVASKIKSKYYLGYHTALEFHGCAYSYYNEVYICINKRDRFDPFEYRNLRFTPVFTNDLRTGVSKRKYLGHQIFVSAPERTFVDCIANPTYAGGWEETLKSLESLRGIKAQNIYQVLQKFDTDFLYRKAGFVLELLRVSSIHYENIDAAFLEKIKTKIGKVPAYLERGKPSTLNKKWNLYIPKKFESVLRGV